MVIRNAGKDQRRRFRLAAQAICLSTPQAAAGNLSFVIPFLHIWRLAIPTYGLMVAVGMVVAYYVLRADITRRKLSVDPSSLAETFIAIPCLAGLVGSKLYSLLETPREFFADPLGQLFSQFGFTWVGGFIAGAAVYIWLARRRRIPLLVMLDVASPAAAIGYAFGRMGCLLSGDGDYGIPTSLPWGMTFPNGLVPTTERVHPTPVYEFIVACLTAWVLWRMGTRSVAHSKLEKRISAANQRTSNSQPPISLLWAGTASTGQIFAAYLVLAGAARFLVEFIRINPRVFLGMTNAQVASIVSMIAGVVLWWHLSATKKSNPDKKPRSKTA
jgi:phosphatidylglycerol:prolipoprotein diacylglycerol transferase